MICMLRRFVLAALAILSVPATSWGQADPSKPLAFVTAVTGGGATHGVDGRPFEFGEFLTAAENGVKDGESVVTTANGTALLTLPGFGTAVHLAPSTEVVLSTRPDLANHVPVKITVRSGQVLMIRRTADERWIALEAVGPTGRAFTVSKQASLTAAVSDEGIVFGSVEGTAAFFSGNMPDEPLVNEAGNLIDRPDQLIEPGTSLRTKQLEQPVRDDENRTAALNSMNENLYNFGVHHSAKWVADAEEGDFTPVRAEARSTPEFFGSELSAGLAFDQPRSSVVSASSGPTTTPLRTPTRSIAEGLLASGVPTSVIIGQRLKRSRIIGNPGTASGAIRFNPQAEQLIVLTGRSR